MTYFKVKIEGKHGGYINAMGNTKAEQRRDAEALAKRYGGKIIRLEAR